MVSVFCFFSSRRRHTRCALVTGVQTCALPILGATSLVRRAKYKPDTADPRLVALLARKPVRVATVAMANKMARIAWALMTRGQVYQAHQDRKSTRLNSSH